MIFRSRAYCAAINALFAEHDLSYIELVPENSFASKLRDAVISAIRSGHRGPFNEQSWIYDFNNAERVVQLNLVAFGFMQLGMEPLLGLAKWERIYNPFVVRDIETRLDEASRYIQRRYQKSIGLRKNRSYYYENGGLLI